MWIKVSERLPQEGEMKDRPLERCRACDEPTGKAGAGDGSLYTEEGIGPFCVCCYDGATCVENILRAVIRRAGDIARIMREMHNGELEYENGDPDNGTYRVFAARAVSAWILKGG